MKKVAIHSLGCKVNSYEAEPMEIMPRDEGYQIVPFSEDVQADIYIINTCSVTNIADRKSRQMLHKAKKMNPEAVVVAAGCYVQADPDGVKKDECVDIILGNNMKISIVEALNDYFVVRIKQAIWLILMTSIRSTNRLGLTRQGNIQERISRFRTDATSSVLTA